MVRGSGTLGADWSAQIYVIDTGVVIGGRSIFIGTICASARSMPALSKGWESLHQMMDFMLISIDCK